MVESFEPTPINPDNQASELEAQQQAQHMLQTQPIQNFPMQNFPMQNQAMAPLQNRPGHLLNVSQHLQLASQNNMPFNQNNLLAAQVHPALYAQTGPLLNNYQGVSNVFPPHLQPMQNNICPNPYNVAQKPMGYPPIPTGITGPMNLVPNFHQPHFTTQPMAANMNPNMSSNMSSNMNQNINVMAMNAAQMGLNASPDVGLPSPFTNDSTRPKAFESALDIVASTAQQSQDILNAQTNQDIGQKLDHLTQKLQGIQEQLKKHALLEASRVSVERATTKRKRDGSSSDSDDHDHSSDGRKKQPVKKRKTSNRNCGRKHGSDDGSVSERGYASGEESKRRPSKKKKTSAPSDDEDVEEEEEEQLSKINHKLNKKWEKMFKLLVKFAKREGHCNVYRYHEEENEKLGMWLCRQRIYHKQRGLDSKLALRLEQCGVVWSVSHAEKMMNLMYQYKMREGNCEVPRFHVEDGMKLGIWLQDQKQQRKRNNLSEERIYRLNKLGIIWDIHDDRWTKMYNLWLEYIRNTGHPNVPRSYSVNGHKLGMWLHTQRKFKKRGAMTDKRSDLLEKAGIVWDVLKECNTRAYTNGMYKDENGRTRRKRLY